MEADVKTLVSTTSKVLDQCTGRQYSEEYGDNHDVKVEINDMAKDSEMTYVV